MLKIAILLSCASENKLSIRLIHDVQRVSHAGRAAFVTLSHQLLSSPREQPV